MPHKNKPFHLFAIPDGRLYNNTLNNFKIRLAGDIIFEQPYEVALIESSFPFNIYNIESDSYFSITRYIQKSEIKFRKEKQYREHTITTVEGRFGKPSSEYSLDYAVRVKMPAGFYSDINHLKNVLKMKIDILLSSSENQLPEYSGSGSVSNYYQEAILGQNRNFQEFFIGLRLGKDTLEYYQTEDGFRAEIGIILRRFDS